VNLPPFLNDIDGDIRLTGHRISLFLIVDYHRRGSSPRQIQRRLPTLSLHKIRRTLEFCRANQADVAAYVAERDEYEANLERSLPRRDKEAGKHNAEAGGLDWAAASREATRLSGDDLV
jgi:uncharacterized protein (DUF433 family)